MRTKSPCLSESVGDVSDHNIVYYNIEAIRLLQRPPLYLSFAVFLYRNLFARILCQIQQARNCFYLSSRTRLEISTASILFPDGTYYYICDFTEKIFISNRVARPRVFAKQI